MQWGSVAEIISNLGTIGALVAAVFAARAAIRTTKQQDRQLFRFEEAEQARADNSKRRQAESVAAWLSLDKESGLPTVRWTNTSGLPVYNLTLFLTIPDGTCKVYYTFGSPTQPRPLPRAQHVLLKQFAEPASYWENLIDKDLFRVALVFRDSANNWWLRDYNGVLCEVADEREARSAVETSESRSVSKR